MKSKKNILFLLFAVLPILSFLLILNLSNENEYYVIEEQKTIIGSGEAFEVMHSEGSYATSGFNYKIEGYFANYYFAEPLIENAFQVVYAYESLFHFLESLNLFVDVPSLLVVEREEEKIMRPRIVGDFLYIMPTDIERVHHHVTALIFQVTSGELPLWICGGISNWKMNEGRVYLSNEQIEDWFQSNNERGWTPFGDAWFTPYMSNTGGDIEGAFNVAYTLVLQLYEKNALVEWDEALLGSLPLSLSTCLQNPIFTAKSPYILVAETPYARYHFNTMAWTFLEIRDKISLFDRCIIFVSDFLEITLDSPLEIYFLAKEEQPMVPPIAAGRVNIETGNIYIYRHEEPENNVLEYFYAYILAHEITHMLLFNEFGFTELLPGMAKDSRDIQAILAEGMAEFVAYSFIQYLGGNYRYVMIDHELKMEMLVLSDTASLLDAIAYFEVTGFEFIEGWRRRLPLMFGEASDFLSEHDTYAQAGSFVQFLYNRYGLSNLLMVYDDYRRVEEMFEMNWNELAELWQNHLGL